MSLFVINHVTYTRRSPGSSVVKHWHTDLAVPGSNPAQGKTVSTVNMVPGKIAFIFFEHCMTSIEYVIAGVGLSLEKKR